jgi:gluconate 2-dehydrogenase alpha chain
MAIIKDSVDVVIVGMGWTGPVMAKELTDEGLTVVALERGADRDTQPDFSYPPVADELEGSLHRRYPQSLNSNTEQEFGKNFIPDTMAIQDFPVIYEELEPHFDFFEYVCGTSGKAGVINGQKVDGGNPYPLTDSYADPPIWCADILFPTTSNAPMGVSSLTFQLPAGGSFLSEYQVDRRLES